MDAMVQVSTPRLKLVRCPFEIGNRVGGVKSSRGFESHPLRFSLCLQVKRSRRIKMTKGSSRCVRTPLLQPVGPVWVDHLPGEALRYLRFQPRITKRLQCRVGLHVDEPGTEHQTAASIT